MLPRSKCNPYWVACDSELPYDPRKPITAKNSPCINEREYNAESDVHILGDTIGGSWLEGKCSTVSEDVQVAGLCYPKISWCNRESENSHRIYAGWHDTCVCSPDNTWGNADHDKASNAPWECNGWTERPKKCESSLPAAQNICGRDMEVHLDMTIQCECFARSPTTHQRIRRPFEVRDTSTIELLSAHTCALPSTDQVTYQLVETVTLVTCPSFIASLGISLGWGLQAEIALTVVILAIFRALGVTKPIHSKAGGIIGAAAGFSSNSNAKEMKEQSELVADLQKQVMQLKEQTQKDC